LEDVVFGECTYPQLLTASDYLGYQLRGGRGRYLQWVTDETSWEGFRGAALAALGRPFPKAIRTDSTARLAVGTKPA
jgi:hypothetical protein